MAAKEIIVLKRVFEILNASAAGQFTDTVDSNNYQRVKEDLEEATREGAMLIARAILSNPSHVHRNLFISSTATALTHGGELPDMAGENDLIEIKPHSAGSFAVGQRRDVQEIQSYRDNPSSIYDSVAHNASGSRLSGYYAFYNGRFYFTGDSAQGYFPSISRTNVMTSIPDEYESTWVALSVGLTPKEGDNVFPIAQYYMNHGERDLVAIASQGIIQPLPTVSRAQKDRGNA